MAEIFETTDHDPYGDLEYCVEWTDHGGKFKTRYFKSKKEADRFALRVEIKLLDRAVRDLLAACKEQSGTVRRGSLRTEIMSISEP